MSHRFLSLLAGLLLAVAPLHADDAEDQAVKAVEQLGGVVKRDGDDPAKLVIEVAIVGPQVTDAKLKELPALQGLQRLELHGDGVTDATLKCIAALKGLRTLDLGSTQATAAGVADLQKALPDCKIMH